MEDRNKIIMEIVSKIFDLIPPDKNELNILIEDYENREVLEVDIKLSFRKLKKEKN